MAASLDLLAEMLTGSVLRRAVERCSILDNSTLQIRPEACRAAIPRESFLSVFFVDVHEDVPDGLVLISTAADEEAPSAGVEHTRMYVVVMDAITRG